MAGISIGMPFSPSGTFPVDGRLVLTRAEMLATDDTKMPDVYFAVCKNDGLMYVYNKNATPNAETGKYTVSSGTSDYEGLSNQPQINGETLIGNKSLEDLGVANLTNEEIKAIVDSQYTAVFG